ncbi:hypothetical protein CPT_Moabite_081 [Serratia phage Moabite]|uniref:Uncharacterized protein n=2 Tax=Moabitevirus moabite TaxID=2846181 RepID=A0A7T3NBM4_9CAUD|nr:hypothetical protein HWC48_gp335 [Serratia phage Moabite]QDB71111.1 hypothetical protein CPT_Moabite_081 [Serratia phage Moabite]QPX76740.1 hypothetical protein [Serratia phage vB_SmaM_Yaphecito]UGO54294.1 hypothetical protein HAYMO_314 [Serratia phage vB_SmaM_Haymo]
MTILNRDMIMQELLNSIDPDAGPCLGLSREKELAEIYTLGFKAPRQTGSTYWLIEKLIEDRNSIVILINSDFKEHFLADVEKYPKVIFDKCLKYGPSVERGILNGDKDNIVDRCFTAREFLNADLERHRYATSVFFDGASTIASKINLNAYYRKLAKEVKGYPVTWLIN